MDIRLDPRLPLVWRDPHTLQVGVDHPVAILTGVTSRHERIISAIAAGHGRSGTGVVAQRAGCRDADGLELVAKWTPALLEPRAPVTLPVHVAGDCPLAEEISSLFTAEGVPTIRVSGDTAEMGPLPLLGVAVSDHVHDPVLARAWLRRDIPHLAVVTGDFSTRIGPLVVPGRTACAHCLDLHRASGDSSWGVIAGQLWGRPHVTQSLVATRDIAVRVVRRVLARVAADSTTAAGDALAIPDAAIETIVAETGALTGSTSRPHPDCGCAALPRIDSVGDPSALAPAPGGSTTGEAVAALA
jgi:hypothetical protein